MTAQPRPAGYIANAPPQRPAVVRRDDEMETDLVKALAMYGGGFFIRNRNAWTRVTQSEGWRIFSTPVEAWFQDGTITDCQRALKTSH